MKAIETERLVIRPFVMDDLEEIHNIRSINVMKRLGFRIVANAHPQWSNEVLGVLDNRSLSEGG